MHSELEKQIYMKQLDGLEVEGKEDWLIEGEILVWSKQSQRQWYESIDFFMLSIDFLLFKENVRYCTFSGSWMMVQSFTCYISMKSSILSRICRKLALRGDNQIMSILWGNSVVGELFENLCEWILTGESL